MKLYRGVPKKICDLYKKKGIPKNSNFSNNMKLARHWGSCVIVVNKSKIFAPYKENNRTYNQLNISDRDFKNTKIIKKFGVIK